MADHPSTGFSGAAGPANAGPVGEGGAPFTAGGLLDQLQQVTAEWTAEGGLGAPALAESVAQLEPLLGRSFLLGQPNLAGMGLAAWDLAVTDPLAALGIDPTARARRMLGDGALGKLLHGDDTEPEDDRPRDPAAPGRVADLLTALDQVRATQANLAADAPADVRTSLADLHNALRVRIGRERRHHPAVDAVLKRTATSPVGSTPVAADALEVVTAGRSRATDDPYQTALDTTLARARTAAPPSAEQAAAVAELRPRIDRAAERARRAEGEAARVAVDRLRRLLAEEVALTAGAPNAHTLALRSEFPAAPRPQARTGDIAPAPGLTEIPIWSSRGEARKVVGYLSAGERQVALDRDGDRVRVANPGGGKPGWVDGAHLDDGKAPWPQPLDAPEGALPFAAGRDADPLAARAAGGPGLGRLAALVSQATGRPVQSLLADALTPGTLARDRAATPADVTKAAAESTPRKARGAEAAGADLDDAPIAVQHVAIDGLDGPDAATRQAVVANALQLLPGRLARKSAARSGRDGRTDRVDVRIDIRAGEAVSVQADRVADQLASAIQRAGVQVVGTLHLGVHGNEGGGESPRAMLARLAAEDREGMAQRLAGERRDLDGGLRDRLARFFGHDFKDVLVFSGPMSGALARSLSAEAVTHGQMVFFDPKHFRPDTAKGEALMAHELAHTRQRDPGDHRAKEAEALATEAAYLDWIQPGGAPFAAEAPIDLNAPGLGGDGGGAMGAMTAKTDRKLESGEGPRSSTAEREQQVEQVLAMVRGLIAEQGDAEGERLGNLGPLVTFKLR